MLIILGAAAGLLGAAIFVAAMRRRGDRDAAKPTAMLIAGMMLTAFGLLLAGFAVGFATSEPLASGSAQ
jgi:uncharacterized YccA/Bax inhibitor family protein